MMGAALKVLQAASDTVREKGELQLFWVKTEKLTSICFGFGYFLLGLT